MGGTLASRGSSNWWVVHNLWYDINGDSILTGTNPYGGAHLYGAADPFACPLHYTNRGFNYYVGRNTFKLNGENAIDVKDSVHAVFSQNTLTGPFNLGGLTGTGGGGAISSHNHARDTWILFNFIKTTPIGIAVFDRHRRHGEWLLHRQRHCGYEGGGHVQREQQRPERWRGGAYPHGARRVHLPAQHDLFGAAGVQYRDGQTDCQLMDNIVSTLTTDHDAFGWEDSGALTGTDRFSHNLVHVHRHRTVRQHRVGLLRHLVGVQRGLGAGLHQLPGRQSAVDECGGWPLHDWVELPGAR